MHVAADKMNMLFICSKNAKAKLWREWYVKQKKIIQQA
jgi:hypothetical protein